MAKNPAKPRPADTEESIRDGKTRYIFKDASELPRSKPDYVVMSPTPLGLRAVPQRDKHKPSPGFVARVRAMFRKIAAR